MHLRLSTLLLAGGLTGLLVLGYRQLIPVYRAPMHSELHMLGDLNGDRQWTTEDESRFQAIATDPHAFPPTLVLKADLDGNGRLEPADALLLQRLAAAKDPYLAEAQAAEAGQPFPRPREFYRYFSEDAYLNRPLHGMPYSAGLQSPLACLRAPRPDTTTPYAAQLWSEIRDEAIRVDQALHSRQHTLTALEQAHAEQKIARCNHLHEEGRPFDLLLELMALAEDAETLTTREQDPYLIQLLRFRDHVRELLSSADFSGFRTGTVPVERIFEILEHHLKQDLGWEGRILTLTPPRDLTHLPNYLSRAQWQYHKSKTPATHFEALVRFAQYDRRYLRAVARTSPKHRDLGLEHHNLPMVLLFREALRITQGDKKAAVGLLDEAIRIPFGWVKRIPSEKLPGALALENFLLPGNKEDGADKSRHWNVFGGLCLYKSPQEALDLALRRELKDARGAGFTPEAVTEFLRDMLANLHGMYHIPTMAPHRHARRIP